MNSADLPRFGALLREMRLLRRLTQEALAERACLSVEAVSALERGHRRAPYPHTMQLLMQALELDATARERFQAAAARSAASRNDSAGVLAQTTSRNAQSPHNFPERLTRFVGRDEELSALADATARHRLTTITGPGGIGKTRIAIELGIGVQERFRNGARFVELAPLRDPALLSQEIAAALQLREHPGQTVLENIVTTLRDQRVLLVIDNCEHLIVEAARVLETILLRCPQITIVATSREALRIDGESVFRLATFSVPRDGARLHAHTAIQHSSVALFVERAQSVDASFRFTDANVLAVTQICQRVDGIPLGLEIVAAQIAIMQPSQIAGRLQQRFLLGQGSRTAVPRQRTLRSLVAWSVDLLSPAEHIVFRRLAVFAGAWTIEAAEAVCAGEPIEHEDVLDHVQALVAKSLVVLENYGNGQRRLRLLEMTRDYAHELLVSHGEHQTIMRRHAAFVFAFAREARSAVRLIPDLTWLELVEAEIDNVRTVLHWSLHERNDVATGAEIAAALSYYWDYRSYEEGTRWLALARDTVDLLEPDLAARVLLESIRIQPYLNDALAFVHRALTEFRRLGNQPGMFAALEVLGKTLINLGQYREACEALCEAIALARAAEDVPSIARLMTTLAYAQLYRNELASARTTLTDAGAYMRADAHTRDSALLLRGFAEMALFNDEVEIAIEFALRVVASLEQLGDKREAATAHLLLAQGLLAAERLHEASIEIACALAALLRAEMPLSYLEATIVAAAILERQYDDRRAARLIGYVQRQTETFAFSPPPLIRALLNGAERALTERMSAADLRFFIAQGRTFDDERVAAEFAPKLVAATSSSPSP